MTIITSAEISPSKHSLDSTGAFVGDDEVGLEVGLFVVFKVGELVGSEVTGDEVGSDVTGEAVGRRDGFFEGAREGHFEGSGLITHDPNEVVSDDPKAPPIPISTLSYETE